MRSSEIVSKRQNLRYEIRRKQIDSLMSNTRKQFSLKIQEDSRYETTQQNSANSMLMRRSLIKNCLNSELLILLPSLRQKIKNNPSSSNIEFVVSVSSNILRDDIQVENKEMIYQYCSQAIKSVGYNQISPLVEIYFYSSVMATCYSALDELQQSQIEDWMLSRLIQLLQNKQINMDRISFSSKDKARTQCIQGVLESLLYFYEPEKDHNCVLLYKVKRSSQYLVSVIYWLKSELADIEASRTCKSILQTWNQIIYNISSLSYSLTSLIGGSEVSILVKTLVDQLHLQSQDLQEIKAFACHSLFNLGEDDPCFFEEYFNEGFFTHLISELENCVSSNYQLELIRLLGCLVDQSVQHKENEQIINNLLECLLSEVVKILQLNQESTQTSLLDLSLKLIRSVLANGHEQGNGQFVQYMSRIGANQLLDHLFIKIKQDDLLRILDQIQHLSNFCCLFKNYITFMKSSSTSSKKQVKCRFCEGTAGRHKISCRLHYLATGNELEHKLEEEVLLKNIHPQKQVSAQFVSTSQQNKENEINYLEAQTLKFEQNSIISNEQKSTIFSCCQSVVNFDDSENEHKSSIIQQPHSQKSTPFTFQQKQIQYLNTFFKYFCKKQTGELNRIITFDYVKSLIQTMNLTQWMQFCKEFKIIEFFQGHKKTPQKLCVIFTKFESVSKRLNFQSFVRAIQYLAAQMRKNILNKISDQRQSVECVKEQLHITSQQRFKDKLICLGAMPVLPKLRKKEAKSLHQQNRGINPIYQKEEMKTFNKNSHKNNKIYLHRQDRIRSRILKNLNVTNLCQLVPSKEIQQVFKSQLLIEDKFLKNYMKRKMQITKGVIQNLHKNSSTYFKKAVDSQNKAQ